MSTVDDNVTEFGHPPRVGHRHGTGNPNKFALIIYSRGRQTGYGSPVVW